MTKAPAVVMTAGALLLGRVRLPDINHTIGRVAVFEAYSLKKELLDSGMAARPFVPVWGADSAGGGVAGYHKIPIALYHRTNDNVARRL